MISEKDIEIYEKVLKHKRNVEETEKNDLISKITNIIITKGLNCGGNYFKYKIKPFRLSFRYTCANYLEIKDEPLVVSLRCEKIQNKYKTRYISFVPYGTETYDISTMTLNELLQLYSHM